MWEWRHRLGSTGEHTYRRRPSECMTVGRIASPDGSIHVTEDSQETMSTPEWGIFLSIVNGSLNPVPVCDLDQVILKELMAENPGLTLLDLKKRSEYSWVTTTSGECPDERETPAVLTPFAGADGHLGEIASSIPPVDPEVLTLKHSAFLAQLLMDDLFRSVYLFSIDPQNSFDGSTNSPGCSEIYKNPGLFKFWADFQVPSNLPSFPSNYRHFRYYYIGQTSCLPSFHTLWHPILELRTSIVHRTTCRSLVSAQKTKSQTSRRRPLFQSQKDSPMAPLNS